MTRKNKLGRNMQCVVVGLAAFAFAVMLMTAHGICEKMLAAMITAYGGWVLARKIGDSGDRTKAVESSKMSGYNSLPHVGE